MALIPCPECKKKISQHAARCVSCGYELTAAKVAEILHKKNEADKFGFVGAVIIAIIGLAVTVWKPSPSDAQISGSVSARFSQVDFDIGSRLGGPAGAWWARDGNGLPSPQGMSLLAGAKYEGSGASDLESFSQGFSHGYTSGFASVKDLPDRKGLRELSWNDMTPGREIFDHNAVVEVVLVSADRERGLITVRYPSGAIEEKVFDALRTQWFVR